MAVVGLFLFPVGHLAFDDARIDSVAAGSDLFAEHLSQQGLIPVIQRQGRAAVAFGQAALEDTKTADVREAIDVELRGAGRLEHQ